jgi:hypothetical protein
VPKLHVPFFDPAAAEGSEDEKMAVFRRVRDEIRDRLVPALPSSRSPTAGRRPPASRSVVVVGELGLGEPEQPVGVELVAREVLEVEVLLAQELVAWLAHGSCGSSSAALETIVSCAAPSGWPASHQLASLLVEEALDLIATLTQPEKQRPVGRRLLHARGVLPPQPHQVSRAARVERLQARGSRSGCAAALA